MQTANAVTLALALVFFTLGDPAFAGSEFALEISGLGKSEVQYQVPSKITTFPLSAVLAKRSGLSAGTAELMEIKEKILYPLLRRSPTAISAIVLEWYPGQGNVLGVSVLWASGESRESLIPRAPAGHYDDKAYEVLFGKPTP